MNVRRLLPFLVLTLALATARAGDIRVTVEVPCPETPILYLYRFGGLHFEPVMQAPVRDGRAEFTLPEQNWQFFYLGASPAEVLPIILGREPGVRVVMSCARMADSSIHDSAINLSYQEAKGKMFGLKGRDNQVYKRYTAELRTGAVPAEFVEEMTEIDRLKLKVLEDTYRTQPFFVPMLALNTQLSYYVQPNEYPSELDYFAGEYFRFAKFDSPEYDYQPWVYESFKAFAGAVAQSKMPVEKLQQTIGQALGKVPADRQCFQLALSGVINALEKPYPEAYLYYAGVYIDKYKDTYPEPCTALEAKMEVVNKFVRGGMAPDFTQTDPDGNPVTLSDLRGKVLLIDFWASWCGPCRRENPNVVKMYNAYKDKGFDILGVSLDSHKERWLDAIAKDGLTWHHVSDLKGWANEAAVLYSVNSIPHTVLVDKDGKILARNLRGPMLEEKLAEIFAQ